MSESSDIFDILDILSSHQQTEYAWHRVQTDPDKGPWLKMLDNTPGALWDVLGLSSELFYGVLDAFGIIPRKTSGQADEYFIELEDESYVISQASWSSETKRWRHDRSPLNAPSNPTTPVKVVRPQGIGCKLRSALETTLQDWTDSLPRSDHVNLFKSVDWTATSIGPIQEWPTALRIHIQMMFVDPRPVCIYWGPQQVAIYNEALLPLISNLHPKLMGSPYKEAFSSTWKETKIIFEHCRTTNSAVHVPSIELYPTRNGYLEETYFDGVFIPILGKSDIVEGVYNSCYEITRLKLANRRAAVLRHVTAIADFDSTSIWKRLTDALKEDERDIPLALLYSAEESPKLNTCSVQLEGLIGLPPGHVSAPQQTTLQDNSTWFAAVMRQARSQGLPTVFIPSDETPSPFGEESMKWLGFGEPSKTIVVLPLFASGTIAGFIILGLNPRRAYDDDYEQFITDLTRLSSAALAAMAGAEQSRLRETRLTRELTERERFIRHLAHIAPVGIYSLSSEGVITWANAKYHELMGSTGNIEDSQTLSFMGSLHPDDISKAAQLWETCKASEQGGICELRLNRKWKPHNETAEQEVWIQAQFLPVFENGAFFGVTGCLSDVSKFLWAEKVQATIAEAAKEAKRQQERFIDLASHEMRNPLSAIIQSADGIVTAVEQHLRSSNTPASEVLQDVLDSAQIVMLCATHQKRIIDDILTVSKLDSAMLEISPVLIQPVETVKLTLHMFNAELQSFDIKSSFVVEPMQAHLAADWVYCDPLRLSQVLVNLITNAIKFTKDSVRREINIKLTATQVPPSSAALVQWYPSDQRKAQAPPPGQLDDDIYLMFSVQDTGKGIVDEEMSRLFNRFVQANAKTHIQYGGSGLGLFISRQITELQGGMIGATSKPGQGSTFAFYIKAQKASKEDIAINQLLVSKPTTTSSRPVRSATPDALMKPPPMVTVRQQSRLLLVEDNLINQKVLKKQLERAGCVVHIANHGLEALDFIRTTRFWAANDGSGVDLDVVLMDWEMPVCDGLTATRKIREHEKDGDITVHLRIVGITANARTEQIAAAFDAGMDDIVPKPFKVQGLLDTIHRNTGRDVPNNPS